MGSENFTGASGFEDKVGGDSTTQWYTDATAVPNSGLPTIYIFFKQLRLQASLSILFLKLKDIREEILPVCRGVTEDAICNENSSD
jgi:hypothetical protein